jgi:hypothetical protein
VRAVDVPEVRRSGRGAPLAAPVGSPVVGEHLSDEA